LDDCRLHQPKKQEEIAWMWALLRSLWLVAFLSSFAGTLLGVKQTFPHLMHQLIFSISSS